MHIGSDFSSRHTFEFNKSKRNTAKCIQICHDCISHGRSWDFQILLRDRKRCYHQCPSNCTHKSGTQWRIKYMLLINLDFKQLRLVPILQFRIIFYLILTIDIMIFWRCPVSFLASWFIHVWIYEMQGRLWGKGKKKIQIHFMCIQEIPNSLGLHQQYSKDFLFLCFEIPSCISENIQVLPNRHYPVSLQCSVVKFLFHWTITTFFFIWLHEFKAWNLSKSM